jgi:hypothetical protein
MAEGERFELSTQLSSGKRLAGARTRPLCDPSACLRQMMSVRQLILSQPLSLLNNFRGITYETA